MGLQKDFVRGRVFRKLKIQRTIAGRARFSATKFSFLRYNAPNDYPSPRSIPPYLLGAANFTTVQPLLIST